MQQAADNLVRENEALRAEVAELRGELARFAEQLAWFQRQVFGRKSERITDLPGTTELLPGFALPEPEPPPDEEPKPELGDGLFVAVLELGDESSGTGSFWQFWLDWPGAAG